MNIPTVKTIIQRLNWLDKVGDPATLARAIRAELEPLRDRTGHSRIHYRFTALDALLQTHGIEYIPHRDDDQHGHYGIDYLNTGDTYTPTICFDNKRRTILIGSWGDIIEKHPTEYP